MCSGGCGGVIFWNQKHRGEGDRVEHRVMCMNFVCIWHYEGGSARYFLKSKGCMLGCKVILWYCKIILFITVTVKEGVKGSKQISCGGVRMV